LTAPDVMDRPDRHRSISIPTDPLSSAQPARQDDGTGSARATGEPAALLLRI